MSSSDSSGITTTTDVQTGTPENFGEACKSILERFKVHSTHRTTTQSHFLQIQTVLATVMGASFGAGGFLSVGIAHWVGMVLGLIMAFEAFNAAKQDGRIADLTDIDATCMVNGEKYFPEGMRPATMAKEMDEAKSAWTVGRTFRLRCCLFGSIGSAGAIASLVLLVLNH